MLGRSRARRRRSSSTRSCNRPRALVLVRALKQDVAETEKLDLSRFDSLYEQRPATK